MIDLASIVRMFCFCWSFLVYYRAWLFKEYSAKTYFTFGPLSSIRSRFTLYCTSSVYNCVDFYLTEFLPYSFIVQKLETKPISKTILKTMLLLVCKIVESVSCILKCRKYIDILKIKKTNINSGCASFIFDHIAI